jgi:hypothetical protein
MTRENPYRKRNTINEELLVKRYTQAKWTLKRCAREQHIGQDRAREILAKHDVKLRSHKPDLDPDVVLAAFARRPSVDYVRSLFGVDTRRIAQILDENGAERLRNRGKRPTIWQRRESVSGRHEINEISKELSAVIGAKVRALRIRNKWSLAKLSELMGWSSPSVVCRAEGGELHRQRKFTKNEVEQLAVIFDVPASHFLMRCMDCSGHPPLGYMCLTCGARSPRPL